MPFFPGARKLNQLRDVEVSSEAQGDILYRDASLWRRLAAVAGRFLKSQGSGQNPLWEAIPVDDLPTVASLRTLGTGAQQAAAGDHTHTLQHATDGYSHGYGTGTAVSLYYDGILVYNNSETDVRSAVVGGPNDSMVEAFGSLYGAADQANALKLRLYIHGVLQAESGYIGTSYLMTTLRGHKIDSGNVEYKLRARNYTASTRQLRVVSSVIAAGRVYV